MFWAGRPTTDGWGERVRGPPLDHYPSHYCSHCDRQYPRISLSIKEECDKMNPFCFTFCRAKSFNQEVFRRSVLLYRASSILTVVELQEHWIWVPCEQETSSSEVNGGVFTSKFWLRIPILELHFRDTMIELWIADFFENYLTSIRGKKTNKEAQNRSR